MAENNRETGVRVKASFFPHAFFLFPPKVDIDGQTHKMSWGSRFFPLSPGKHVVRVHTTYAFAYLPNNGISHSLEIPVQPGEQQTLTFWMWPWSTGSLRAC